MSENGLPAPSPTVSPEAGPYWAATAEGRLVLPRCRDCGSVVWYPRGFCPNCSSSAIEWIESSARGTVYSFTVVRRGATGPYRGAEPYVVAYVELDEGPRVMTNVVGVDPDALRIGDRVEAVYADTGEGTSLVRFKPA